MSDKPYDDPHLLEKLYWEEGMSMSEMADYFGCSRYPLYERMEKWNIDRKDPGEAGREAVRVERASYYTNDNGYEVWFSKNPESGEYEAVYVHRLLAVLEYGFDAVREKDVHHENHIPWGNWSENITLMDPDEHIVHHGREYRKGAEV